MKESIPEQYFAHSSRLGYSSSETQPKVPCVVYNEGQPDVTSGEYDHLIKVIIIGCPGSGKTSLMQRFVQNHFDDHYISTIGVDFKMKTLSVGEDIVRLQVWDTAGQERFRSITRSYYRNSHGCLAMFDLSNRNSFLQIEEMLAEFKNSGLAQYSDNIVLVGGKSDLDFGRETRTDAIQLANKYKIPYFEVSSKEDSGVQELFFQITYNALTEKKLLQKQETPLPGLTRQDKTLTNRSQIEVARPQRKQNGKGGCC